MRKWMGRSRLRLSEFALVSRPQLHPCFSPLTSWPILANFVNESEVHPLCPSAFERNSVWKVPHWMSIAIHSKIFSYLFGNARIGVESVIFQMHFIEVIYDRIIYVPLPYRLRWVKLFHIAVPKHPSLSLSLPLYYFSVLLTGKILHKITVRKNSSLFLFWNDS